MRPSAFRKIAAATLVAVVALGSFSAADAKPGKRKGPKPKNKAPKPAHQVVDEYAPACVGNPDVVETIDITVNGQSALGLYAMPSVRPKGVVVFGHGYGHTMESWRKHLTTTAKRNGVVAVAMNYRGQTAVPPAPGSTLPGSRGWRVREGAEDSIAAAQLFERACPTARTIVMYGVSMGGNTAGLAVAAQAKRAGGRLPLFDYLFDIEGAVNVTETYLEARGLALSGNTFAKNAVEDIEQEMADDKGNPQSFEDNPDRYLEHTVVNRVDDIAAAGVKGVVIVHGVDDGLVGYNQTPEFALLLRKSGIPVDVFTAITHGQKTNPEPGTTLDGYVTGNIPGFVSPFAGHASEVSETHIVGAAGFERLAALFRNESIEKPACRTGVLDGTLGYTAANPKTLEPGCVYQKR